MLSQPLGASDALKQTRQLPPINCVSAGTDYDLAIVLIRCTGTCPPRQGKANVTDRSTTQ